MSRTIEIKYFQNFIKVLKTCSAGRKDFFDTLRIGAPYHREGMGACEGVPWKSRSVHGGSGRFVAWGRASDGKKFFSGERNVGANGRKPCHCKGYRVRRRKEGRLKKVLTVSDRAECSCETGGFMLT